MKIYEKPVVELVSFQAEEVMSEVDGLALNGYVGYSEIETNFMAL